MRSLLLPFGLSSPSGTALSRSPSPVPTDAGVHALARLYEESEALNGVWAEHADDLDNARAATARREAELCDIVRRRDKRRQKEPAQPKLITSGVDAGAGAGADDGTGLHVVWPDAEPLAPDARHVQVTSEASSSTVGRATGSAEHNEARMLPVPNVPVNQVMPPLRSATTTGTSTQTPIEASVRPRIQPEEAASASIIIQDSPPRVLREQPPVQPAPTAPLGTFAAPDPTRASRDSGQAAASSSRSMADVARPPAHLLPARPAPAVASLPPKPAPAPVKVKAEPVSPQYRLSIAQLARAPPAEIKLEDPEPILPRGSSADPAPRSAQTAGANDGAGGTDAIQLDTARPATPPHAFARADRIAHVRIALPQPTSGPPPVRLAAFVSPAKDPPQISPEMAHAQPVKPPSAAPGAVTMNALVRPPAPGQAFVPTLVDFTKRKEKVVERLRAEKLRASRHRSTPPRDWVPRQVRAAPGDSGLRVNGVQVGPLPSSSETVSARRSRSRSLSAAPPPNSSTKRKRSRQPSEAPQDSHEPPMKRAEVLAPVREDDDMQMSPEPEPEEVIVYDVPGSSKRADESKADHDQHARPPTDNQPVQQATDNQRVQQATYDQRMQQANTQPATHDLKRESSAAIPSSRGQSARPHAQEYRRGPPQEYRRDRPRLASRIRSPSPARGRSRSPYYRRRSRTPPGRYRRRSWTRSRSRSRSRSRGRSRSRSRSRGRSRSRSWSRSQSPPRRRYSRSPSPYYSRPPPRLLRRMGR